MDDDMQKDDALMDGEEETSDMDTEEAMETDVSEDEESDAL